MPLLNPEVLKGTEGEVNGAAANKEAEEFQRIAQQINSEKAIVFKF